MLRISNPNTGGMRVYLVCTTCPREDWHDVETFRGNINLFQGEGWLVVKDEGKWKHFCPYHNPHATEEQKIDLQERIDYFRAHGEKP